MTAITDTIIDEALDGYVTCMLWTGLDETGTEDGGNPEPLDANYGADDISEEAMATMRTDVATFIAANLADCMAYEAECLNGGRIGYNGVDGGPWAWLGHDIALTRNRHGAGFWDRGIGELGERLTEACKPMGTQDLYVADDGTLAVA